MLSGIYINPEQDRASYLATSRVFVLGGVFRMPWEGFIQAFLPRWATRLLSERPFWWKAPRAQVVRCGGRLSQRHRSATGLWLRSKAREQTRAALGWTVRIAWAPSSFNSSWNLTSGG